MLGFQTSRHVVTFRRHHATDIPTHCTACKCQIMGYHGPQVEQTTIDNWIEMQKKSESTSTRFSVFPFAFSQILWCKQYTLAATLASCWRHRCHDPRRCWCYFDCVGVGSCLVDLWHITWSRTYMHRACIDLTYALQTVHNLTRTFHAEYMAKRPGRWRVCSQAHLPGLLYCIVLHSICVI